MKTKKKHVNIPIFIPELACPHQCVFCNQQKISGTYNTPKPSDIDKIINKYLITLSEDTETEIAFFGGSFTGIPYSLQKEYLKGAYKFIEDKKIKSIRISTRPDYINDKVLDLLKKYGVKTIELGAQSTDDYVLKKSGRGHSFNDIRKASRLIKKNGFQLGLQMMIGLPGDTMQKSINTAKDIIELNADNTRIYPTIIVKDTALDKLYKNGEYEPLSIDEAVKISKELIKFFELNNVSILRVGLHPSEEITPENSFIAGPLHSSFKELVLTDIWRDILSDKIENSEKRNFLFKVNSKQLNYAVGFKKKNTIFFYEKGYKLKFVGDKEIRKFEIYECDN